MQGKITSRKRIISMKYLGSILIISFLFIGCNSVKRNQKYIAKGDYDKAIDLSVKKLQKDKTSSKSDAHILLLEDAFAKAVEEDKREISFQKKGNNPAEPRITYYLYTGLKGRQEHIRPLLPLYSNSLGRNAKFKLVDYSSKIIAAKGKYLNYLYDIGLTYMNFNTISDYRLAYTTFCELTDIHPNYRDSQLLLDESHFKGTDFVFVSLNNHSGQIMPYELERDLLNFNTYGLDDFWTEYHTENQSNVDYNFGIDLDFTSIAFSPERISEKEIQLEKEIQDGWEYKRDRNGDIVYDSDGNAIKIDTFIIVTATLTETIQSKSVLVGGDVVYRDFQSNREMDQFPLASEFIFENIFANYRGDERALSKEDKILIKNKFIPFPSNPQMLIDAGEDVKQHLKEILEENSFR